jgi:hypothetical protein
LFAFLAMVNRERSAARGRVGSHLCKPFTIPLGG